MTVSGSFPALPPIHGDVLHLHGWGHHSSIATIMTEQLFPDVGCDWGWLHGAACVRGCACVCDFVRGCQCGVQWK